MYDDLSHFRPAPVKQFLNEFSASDFKFSREGLAALCAACTNFVRHLTREASAIRQSQRPNTLTLTPQDLAPLLSTSLRLRFLKESSEVFQQRPQLFNFTSTGAGVVRRIPRPLGLPGKTGTGKVPLVDDVSVVRAKENAKEKNRNDSTLTSFFKVI
eukprot:Lankesteria_metandrocarpae@DN4040_c0_g1_i1.p1